MSRGRLAAAAGAIALVLSLSGNLRSLHSHPILPDGGAAVEVSVYPAVVAINATPQQQLRLEEALERFRSANLPLPPLHVEFHSDTDACGGHLGVFQPQFTPWRIMICNSLDAVYEHELAHVWELANVDDDTRQEFMAHRELKTWNDAAVPWNQRGNEQAAFIIQQGLVELALPPTLSAENRSRLVGYAILTGRPAPRLLRWIGLDSGVPQLVRSPDTSIVSQ